MERLGTRLVHDYVPQKPYKVIKNSSPRTKNFHWCSYTSRYSRISNYLCIRQYLDHNSRQYNRHHKYSYNTYCLRYRCSYSCHVYMVRCHTPCTYHYSRCNHVVSSHTSFQNTQQHIDRKNLSLSLYSYHLK